MSEIERSAKHLDRLVTQLIALARADESVIAPREEGLTVDLVAAAADVLAELAPVAASRNVELAFEPASESVNAIANADIVREILTNLVDNAIRYNDEKGNVVVRVGGDGAGPFLQVLDDGPGIASAMRERVFDRFYRIPMNNQRSGAGLGLPIVRSLVEQNNGTITLDDGPDGKGLSITVRLTAEGVSR